MPPIRAAPRAPARPVAQATRLGGRRSASSATRGQRRIGVAMLGLLAASFAALLFVLYQIFVGGGSSPAAATRAAPTIPANARRFNSLADFEKGGKPSGPFAITLTETEINQRMNAELAKQPNLPFRNVVGKVLDDRVDFTGLVKAAGVEMSSTVSMRFFPQNGKLGYEITSINFGPVPVPGIAKQAIQDNVDQQLGTQKFLDQWALDDVQTRTGAMTLVGHAK